MQYANGLQYQGIWIASGSLGNLSPVTNAFGFMYAPHGNFSGFQDDAYTQLLDQVIGETDPSKQQQLYGQLNDYYLDQSWVQQLMPNPEHAVAHTNVHGLRYDSRPGLVLGEVWLS